MHTVHALQVELTCVLNCPSTQAAHFRSDVAVGAVVWALPAGQVVNAEHFLSEVAVAAVDSYWAAVHAVNAEHFLSETAVAAIDSYWAAVPSTFCRKWPSLASIHTGPQCKRSAAGTVPLIRIYRYRTLNKPDQR